MVAAVLGPTGGGCKPAPEEGSAVERLQHLVDTERLSMPVRVQALLAG